MHNQGVCILELSKSMKLSCSTVERWNHEILERKIKEKLTYSCPRVLGIDEHFFTKKKGFATTFCDLEKHRIYDVALGRSSFDLHHKLRQLEGREKVRVVVMDMCESYRKLTKIWFPNAQIVLDRFHVIRLINQHFLKYWKEADEVGRKTRRLLKLARYHRHNLTDLERVELERYLNKHPGIQAIYNFKQKLCKLFSFKGKSKWKCVKLVKIFVKYLEYLKKSPLYSLGKTLESWSNELVLMWRFSRNNSITEGFHTKMEMISRRAYGFRNFENYRLRVRALCA